MTDLSTTNIQRLLDQATPGPWEYQGAEFHEITAQDSDGLEQSVINPDRYTEREFCNRPADFELAALAPELAQEVLRMREELNSMKRAWLFMTIEPRLSGLERTLATQALNSIDEVLGDHDG